MVLVEHIYVVFLSVFVKGSKLIEVGIDTFRKPENGEQRRDILLVLMSVLL